jgi:hypothetical protein
MACIKYNINCNTLNQNMWTPVHEELKERLSLRRLPSLEMIRVEWSVMSLEMSLRNTGFSEYFSAYKPVTYFTIFWQI